MSDSEPRRSSRSTKGQNKRLEEEERREEAEAAERRKRRPPAKKTEWAEVEEDSFDDDNGGGEVKCVCGATGDGLGDSRPMAECEKCLSWQHIRCMFGADSDNLLPQSYTCVDCTPELYPGLEKKWPACFSKKSRDGGNAPAPAAEEEVPLADVPETTVAASSSLKDAAAKASSASVVTEQEHKPSQKISSLDRKRPSPVPVSPVSKSKKSRSVHTPAQSVSTVDRVRASVVKSLAKIFVPVVPKAESIGSITLEDGDTSESYATKLATTIEHELYDLLAVHDNKQDVGPAYRDKFRNLSFNLRDDKNAGLRLRVVGGNISPRAVAQLTSDQMANPELQKLAEDVRKESMRETVLKVEEGPRLRRTHKGEEIVGGEDMYLPSEKEAQEEKDAQKEEEAAANSISAVPASMPPRRNTPMPKNMQQTGLWEEDDANITREGSVDLDDDDLDAVLNIDNGSAKTVEHAPPTSELPIWKGHVKMDTVTEFDGTATHFSALNRKWNEIFDLKRSITIQGRLDQKAAGDYLAKVGSSKEFAIFSFGPQCEDLEKLYHYFHDRKKYGVIANRRRNIKDAYIIPLGKEDVVPKYLYLPDAKMEELKKLQQEQKYVVLALFVVSHRDQTVHPSNGNGSVNPQVSSHPTAQKTRSTTPPTTPSSYKAAQQMLSALADPTPPRRAGHEPVPFSTGTIMLPGMGGNSKTGASSIDTTNDQLSNLEALLKKANGANSVKPPQAEIDTNKLLAIIGKK